MIAIKNAVLFDGVREVGETDLLLDAAIVSMGRAAELPRDVECIDVDGAYVTPGLVDAHVYMGLWCTGAGSEGRDHNDSNGTVQPQLRALDSVDWDDANFGRALAGGVATVVTGSGESNIFGGQAVAMRTERCAVTDRVLRDSVSLRVSLGHDPKTTYSKSIQYPSTRMGVAAVVREQFVKAQEYEAGCREAIGIAKRPKFDSALHTLAEVMARKTPVTFYADKANDIVTAVRLTREFDLNGIIVGATEGCLVAEFLGESGVPVVFIPLLDGRMSVETRNSTFETAAVLAAAGVDVAISTGAPSLPSEYLPVIAALCMKAGLARDTALRAITSSPAAIFGLVQNGPQNTAGPGHIACGAPADLVVWEGDPFSLTGWPRLVIAAGNVAFDSCIDEAPW